MRLPRLARMMTHPSAYMLSMACVCDDGADLWSQADALTEMRLGCDVVRCHLRSWIFFLCMRLITDVEDLEIFVLGHLLWAA